MPVVPLNAAATNKADFVNSLFSGDVRVLSAVEAAIQGGALTYSFADATSDGLVLNSWLAAWQHLTGGDPDPPALAMCSAPDLALIDFLSQFLGGQSVDLCVPQLALSSYFEGMAVYENQGYTRQGFVTQGEWDYGSFDDDGNPSDGTVAVFLHLLFYGAHVVVIDSEKDGGGDATNFGNAFKKALHTSVDFINSHYGGAGVLSSEYYAPVDAPVGGYRDHETLDPTDPPGQEPLLLAFLVGQTAETHPNNFLQLEGWPAQRVPSPPGGTRHDADYGSNMSTLWNFATYGACAYSEKRSTPVFVANDAFDLTLHADTGMPYYWGANQGNVGAPWMHPDLVVFSGGPRVPARLRSGSTSHQRQPKPREEDMSTHEMSNESVTLAATLPVPLSCVPSYSGPLPGQRHRSSGDFSTAWALDGAKQLQFSCPSGVSFDVMLNKVGHDPTLWTGVTNGTTKSYESHSNLYIANPSGSAQAFEVEIWVS